MQNRKPISVMIAVVCMTWISSPVWVGSLPVAQAASQAASVPELLQRYTQALDATESFTDAYEEVSDYSYRMPDGSRVAKGRRFARGQHRADGARLYMQNYYWGDFNPKLMDLPESDSRYNLRIEADGRHYNHSTAVNDPRVKGTAALQPAHQDKAAITIGTYSGIYGFLGSDERLDAVLRGAKRISMRPTTETVSGVACHVIDADTRYGQYTVWLDPVHGYNAAKVTRKATGGHRENQWLMPKGDHARGAVVITRFERVGSMWVPAEADQETVYTSGELFRRSSNRYKRSNIVLNPDHDKLGSFDNPLEHPANDPELKNGRRVRITTPGSVKVKGSWQDGKVVDESGKIVDVAQLWAATELSLLDTPLPSLTDLSKDLSQVQTGNKPLLVCLCDIQQRPSRQCLSRLSKMVAALSARGFGIVVVQASSVDLKRYQTWLKNEIGDLRVHMCEGDFGVKKKAWAVKGLPWMILTDKDHVVRAEGLSLDELQLRIK
ncbi:MAG: hypothetical protein ACYS0H_03375 [Planctomycetota bacterium]